MGEDSPVRSCETPRARVGFDGKTVTVRRRLAPLMPARVTTYSLREVLGARLYSLGGEGERAMFELHLTHDTPSVRIPVRFGANPHHAGPQRARRKWDDLARAIGSALGSWERKAIEETTGWGPWSVSVWERVEAMAPELHVYTEWAVEVPPLQGRRARTHRECIEASLLKPVRDGVAGGGFLGEDSPLGRVRAQAWFNLIVKLDGGRW
ncbi:hypothetical protein [Actinoplanes regularis]|uniref:hypothetical protein n=1 Tax=Actinoplanes regularis TaxID=52697 RepID=UPI0024A41219|nr:hypothetical protein [Actinoplanes regularis]GLW30514.1 hypothetical protein Areg01_34540 [Actinoplanes regularis]